MYRITKDVFFCYGHRLMAHPGKCRHLHGHSVKASITLFASELNDQGMVMDFSEVSAAAMDYIDGTLDHNFLLHRKDPIVPLLEQAGERFLLIDQHPTAEVLAEMIFNHLKDRGFPVEDVTLWETTSACASYRP
jgi:6-pyruvoyltetrahydropterin/6-carboxytetrahydropterin synthase